MKSNAKFSWFIGPLVGLLLLGASSLVISKLLNPVCSLAIAIAMGIVSSILAPSQIEAKATIREAVSSVVVGTVVVLVLSLAVLPTNLLLERMIGGSLLMSYLSVVGFLLTRLTSEVLHMVIFIFPVDDKRIQ